MNLYIDPRAGSNKLLDKFPEESKEMTLDAGDVAFWGNGPDNEPWFIGIEYKTLDDFCASMKSGRLTGTQLPGMLRLYNVSFILVEGIGFLDRRGGQLVKKIGKMSYPMGVYYTGYQNFLTSVHVHSALSGRPCFIQRTIGIEETVATIRATFDWFQKPWEHHTNISRPDLTKTERVSYDLEVLKVEPTDPEYPVYWLRKAIFQLERMGWDKAGKLAAHFKTMDALVKATQKDFESVDGVGKGLAERMYVTLHAGPDPTIQKKKRKSQHESEA